MKTWYTITNKGEGKPAEVLIYDEIGVWGISASRFVQDLKASGHREITLRINSPGGSVFDGVAIHNYLRTLDKVTVEIDGLCASIATVISMAGTEIRMASNALFMIHNPMGGAFGEADEMRKTAELMDKVREQILSAYLARLGDDQRDQVESWMDAETWFSAQEAKEAGFIDTITGAVEIAARVKNFNLSAFGRVPEAMAVAGNQPAAQPQPQPNQAHQMKNLLKLLATAGVIANAEASEDSVVAEAQTYLAKLTKDNANLNTQVTNLNARVQELLTDQAEAAVQAAVDSKRIKDDKDLRAKWVAAYLNDPEGTKALLGGIEAPAAHAPAPKALAGHPPINTGAEGNSVDEQIQVLSNELKTVTDGVKRYDIVQKLKKLRNGATA